MAKAIHLSMMEIPEQGEPTKIASLAVFNDPEKYTKTIIDFIQSSTKPYAASMKGTANTAIVTEAINLIMKGTLQSLEKTELASTTEFVIILRGKVGEDTNGKHPKLVQNTGR